MIFCPRAVISPTPLHLLSETRVDAVILDIGLPGIDGLTLLERLRG
jgi:DNA-binding response OmpR family regulator